MFISENHNQKDSKLHSILEVCTKEQTKCSLLSDLDPHNLPQHVEETVIFTIKRVIKYTKQHQFITNSLSHNPEFKRPWEKKPFENIVGK